MTSRIDLDELARLGEERTFLLRSIADLDAEHEAGDLDDADYLELRDGYVARAAETIRRLEAGEAGLAAAQAARPKLRKRTIGVAAAVCVFAIAAGIALASAVGSRGSGGLTGTVGSAAEEGDRCRGLTMTDPAEGIECYDRVLKDHPDDVEALTYQGWAKVRSGDVTGGSELFDRVVELDPTFPDVRVFRASVMKNAEDFAGAQAELDALYELNPSALLLSTLEQMGLEATVARGLLAPDVAACWDKQEKALAAVDESLNATSADEIDKNAVAGAFADLALAAGCLDEVLAQRPDDTDALVMKSLALGLLGLVDRDSVPAAVALADRVLEIEPGSPDALLLRSVWQDNLGNFDAASDDLDALGDRRVSPLIGQFVDREAVRADIAAQVAEASATTSTTAASTTNQ